MQVMMGLRITQLMDQSVSLVIVYPILCLSFTIPGTRNEFDREIDIRRKDTPTATTPGQRSKSGQSVCRLVSRFMTRNDCNQFSS